MNERTITNYVARISPWLAPFPTAFLVWRATQVHLDWPWYVALIAAVVLEALGLSAINTVLEFRVHNKGLKAGDKRTAPFALAVGVVAVYLTAAVGLTVLLDTATWLAVYAPIIFPLLGVSGMTIIAIRADQERRREEMVLSLSPPYSKKQHKLERARMLAEMDAPVVTPPVPKPTKADKPDMPAVAIAEEVLPELPRTATMADWRGIIANRQSGDVQVGVDGVKVLLQRAGLAAPSQRTLYNWAKMTRNDKDAI